MKGEGNGRDGKRRGGGKGRGDEGRGGERKEGEGRGGQRPHTNAGTWAPSYLATLLGIEMKAI